MAQVNVTFAGSVSSRNVKEVEWLQCRVENVLATALAHVRSGATPESIDNALERVYRAATLLMRAQDVYNTAETQKLPLAA